MNRIQKNSAVSAALVLLLALPTAACQPPPEGDDLSSNSQALAIANPERASSEVIRRLPLGTATPVFVPVEARPVQVVGVIVPTPPPLDSANVQMCTDMPAPAATPPMPESNYPAFHSDGSLAGKGSTPGVIRQGLAGQVAKMWPIGQRLRVRMMGGSEFVRGKVRQYASEWSKYGNIDFDFADVEPCDIRVAFEKGQGSWSAVGRDSLARSGATMNFGWFTDETADSEFSRVVVHEFGHALGLVHEQQSPAAGIAWDRQKVYKYFADTQKWSPGEVDANVLNKYSGTDTNYSAYDPLSIMHYSIPAALTLDNKGTPWNYALSASDRSYIGQWYPFDNAQRGQLRTGDDCDTIDFLVEYKAVASDRIDFHLKPGAGINWWKAIGVPLAVGGESVLGMQDFSEAFGSYRLSDLDRNRSLGFGKAKFLGYHTRLGYEWGGIKALPGGTRVTLTWTQDRCP